MKKYGIAIDSQLCMACYNCSMACKDEHCGFDTPVSKAEPHMGQFWINIRSRERGDDTRKIKTVTVATPCSHCENPACEAVSKDGAVYKRQDGIVIIDPDKAKGQKQIVDACPIGAIYWNEEENIPQKCTMCAHLLDEGYASPRCVEACPNGALVFGDLNDPDSEISKKIAENRVTQLKELIGESTNVVHLNIPTVFLAGSVYLPDDEAADGAEIVLTCKENGKLEKTITNYFGDWEKEGLTQGASYDVKISCPGYKSITLNAITETDHYIGEVILDKE